MAGRIYDVEYFTGSQASIYIGDVLVDEVESIAWNLQQSKQPVYGYASQLFDAVIRGNVLVQGQFTVNFIDNGYLFAILARALGHSPSSDEDNKRLWKILSQPTSTEAEQTDASKLANTIIQKGFQDNLSRTRMLIGLAKQAAENALKVDFQQTGLISQLAKTVDSFSDTSQELKNILWGDSTEGTHSDLQDDPIIKRADDFDSGFDINVTYGFRVGSIDSSSAARSTSFTNKKIKNIHILGSSQSVDSSDNPIAETYSFIARELI